MASKMLRFSVCNIYIRSFMGCDFNLLRFTPIQRFQHSERGKDYTVGKINISAPKIQNSYLWNCHFNEIGNAAC